MTAALRPELRAVLDALLAQSAPGARISLDALGDAIGTRPAASDEIDAMITALEAAGRHVGDDAPAAKIAPDLARVVASARALSAQLGRRPTAQEIAQATGLGVEQVRAALALAQVMSR